MVVEASKGRSQATEDLRRPGEMQAEMRCLFLIFVLFFVFFVFVASLFAVVFTFEERFWKKVPCGFDPTARPQPISERIRKA